MWAKSYATDRYFVETVAAPLPIGEQILLRSKLRQPMTKNHEVIKVGSVSTSTRPVPMICLARE
jgi:hypothetical protein